MLSLLWFLIIGLVAGWLASLVMKSRMGIPGYLLFGVIGAFIGGFIFRLLGFATVNTIGALVSAFVGAVVLIAIVRAMRKA